jgi:hypothetical protein
LSKLTEEPLAATAIGEVDRKGIYFNYRTAVFVWCSLHLFRFKRQQKKLSTPVTAILRLRWRAKKT